MLKSIKSAASLFALNACFIGATALFYLDYNKADAVAKAEIACSLFVTDDDNTRVRRRCREKDFPTLSSDGQRFIGSTNVAKEFNALIARL